MRYFLLRPSETFVFIILAGLLVFAPGAPAEQKGAAAPAVSKIKAFQPGESLSYDISWSNLMKAGVAVLEVRGETLPGGKKTLRFVVTSRSLGVLDKLYQLGDMIESVFDPEALQSLSYSLRAQHGKKTRRRDITFDYEKKAATSRLNEDPPETVAIPGPVQDPLTALYYLRTLQDFSTDHPATFKAFDSDSVSEVEVQTLGRERVKTPAGEFATIRILLRRGLFMSEGEVFVWLSDDDRKIPVLIRGKVPVGNIVFTLTAVKPGVGP